MIKKTFKIVLLIIGLIFIINIHWNLGIALDENLSVMQYVDSLSIFKIKTYGAGFMYLTILIALLTLYEIIKLLYQIIKTLKK